MRGSFITLTACACLMLCAGGASCPKRLTQTPLTQPPPTAFVAEPGLAEIMRAVNSNSGRVQSLRAESTRLSVSGYPSLRADLSMQRPKNFRLRAKLLAAPVLDVGCNSELFWFWVREAPTQSVLYARHDQFAQSSAAQVLPIEPTWLPEAMGLAYFDPAETHDGPRRNGNGNFEVTSHLQTASGPRVKVTEIHPQYGWVLRQDIANPTDGRLLISARCSDHRYYPLPPQGGVSLPLNVKILLAPPDQPAMSMEIAVTGYAVNQLLGLPEDAWRMPEIDGYPPMDLARMRLSPGSDLAASPTQWQRWATPPRVSEQRPIYRGYSR